MDENKLLVLDASVLIKWLVAEMEHLEEALFLRSKWKNEEIEIIVPGHCFTEIMNAVSRKYPNLANSSLSYLLNCEIQTHLMTLEAGSIANMLVKKYKIISFYDAIYHALAITQNGTFLTADKKYYDTAKKIGHIAFINDVYKLL